VKEFAQDMAAFRLEQIARLRAFAQEHGTMLPEGKEFEHQVVLENLEPLDYLALSRRYAEIQVQSLEQELRGYAAAAQSADSGLSSLATATIPSLQQHLQDAQDLQRTVGP
jgi:predicted outer membrane protein